MGLIIMDSNPLNTFTASQWWILISGFVHVSKLSCLRGDWTNVSELNQRFKADKSPTLGALNKTSLSGFHDSCLCDARALNTNGPSTFACKPDHLFSASLRLCGDHARAFLLIKGKRKVTCVLARYAASVGAGGNGNR